MEDIQKVATVDIIKQLTSLERDIQLAVLKYEKYRLELIRRFPGVELDTIEVKKLTKDDKKI